MVSRFFIRNFILCGLIASCQLRIPVGEVEIHLDNEIRYLLQLIDSMRSFFGVYCVITYTGHIDLRPSLQQMIMDNLSLPIFNVGSDLGPVNHHYLKAENLVIAFFTGLNDPTLAALNDKELGHDRVFLILLHVLPPNTKELFTADSIRELFNWCWDHSIDRIMLIIRGEKKIELWSFYHLDEMIIFQIESSKPFLENIRRHNYRFVVQVVNDPPAVFWYNSSEQANVTGGDNISLSGPIGVMIVDFMRHLNVTMDIIPSAGHQTSKYEIFRQPDDRRVDVVANMVYGDHLHFSPIVADSQICVVVSNRRMIPPSRFMDEVISLCVHRLTCLASIGIFLVKYFSQRRRSFLDPIFNTIRFYVAIPLPNGRLERLPIADKILEVFVFFFVGLLVSSNVSVLSTAFTAGIFKSAITNAETLRASGLKIMTDDPTIPLAFDDDLLPSSLADRVFLVDFPTMFHHILTLNDSYAYVVKTPNWQSLRLYQQRLKTEILRIVGGDLCSKSRPMRVPINPRSPLRFLFKDYFHMVFESGLQQKWIRMGFEKFREIRIQTNLPTDINVNWRPLTIEYFAYFIKLYIGGMVISTMAFGIEMLYNRYRS
nr:uncharacterized protein LOC108069001 [Drosophila takahashii]